MVNSALAAHEAVLGVLMADETNLECSAVDSKATPTYLTLSKVPSVLNLANSEGMLCSAIADCRLERITPDKSTFCGISSSNGHVTCVSFLVKSMLPLVSEKGPTFLLAQFCHIDSSNHVMVTTNRYEKTVTEAVYRRHLQIIECLKKSVMIGAETLLKNKIGLDALAKAVCSASEMGLFKIVTRLTEFGCNELATTIPPFYFIQAMVIAAEKGHLPIVELFHDSYYVSLKSLDDRGECALNVAAANGHRQVVDYIIEAQSFDLNAEERYRLSLPLRLAAKNGHDAVVRSLVEAGADLESRDSEGCTALMLAAQYGQTSTVSFLLEQGAKLRACNNNGWTALMLVVFHKVPFETVKLLLDDKDIDFNLNATTRDGNNLLILASRSGYVEVASYLLENGANISIANNDGMTPLMEASKNGHLEIVKLLLFWAQRSKQGESLLEFLNQTNNDGFTALMFAAGNGDEKVTSILIHNGSDVNLSNETGSNALVLAIENCQAGTAKLLVEAGANVNFRRASDGWTPLMIAARYDNLSELVKILVDKGANVNAINDDDGLCHPALLIAAYRGNVNVTNVLIDLGADVTICDKFGCNCLILAARGGHAALTESLLSRKEILALINKTDFSGKTALNYAKLRNFDYVARVLVKNGADS